MHEDFLLEAVHGGHRPMQEERLTRIFVACFNHSCLVRKAIGELFRGDYNLCHAKAEIRGSKGDKRSRQGRRDIEICEGEQVRLIIENKITAPLTFAQLLMYKRARKGAKVCALIKEITIKDSRVLETYDVKRWNELYYLLDESLEKAKEPDKFVARQLMSYLKEHRMDTKVEFKKRDIAKCAEFLYQLRFNPKSYANLGYRQLETMGDWQDFLRTVLESAAESRHFVTRVGRKFRREPILSWWNDDNMSVKQHDAWLGVWLGLKKTYQGVKYLSFGLRVRENKDWIIEVAGLGNDKEYAGKKYFRYRKRDISKEWLRRDILKRW
ncbi:MAG: PD-(D/E)XK nuclease family protein, partial [Candidatus Omnitrophica bacterium]|nr:PD-(D/E)XK nuclease family protein [Candidatus Omnitrophota bacterium]